MLRTNILLPARRALQWRVLISYGTAGGYCSLPACSLPAIPYETVFLWTSSNKLYEFIKFNLLLAHNEIFYALLELV